MKKTFPILKRKVLSAITMASLPIGFIGFVSCTQQQILDNKVNLSFKSSGHGIIEQNCDVVVEKGTRFGDVQKPKILEIDVGWKFSRWSLSDDEIVCNDLNIMCIFAPILPNEVSVSFSGGDHGRINVIPTIVKKGTIFGDINKPIVEDVDKDWKWEKWDVDDNYIIQQNIIVHSLYISSVPGKSTLRFLAGDKGRVKQNEVVVDKGTKFGVVKTPSVTDVNPQYKWIGWDIKDDATLVDDVIIVNAKYYLISGEPIGYITLNDRPDYVIGNFYDFTECGLCSPDPNQKIYFENEAYERRYFDYDFYFNEPVISIPDYFLANCVGFSGKIFFSPNIIRIGNGFMQSCKLYNFSLIFPESSSGIEIGNNFLYGCSEYNNDITSTKVWKIGDNFLSNCQNFNSDLEFPSLSQIGNEFLSNCQSFNRDLYLTNVLQVGDKFLADCKKFNHSIQLTNLLRTGDYFMANCSNFQKSIWLPFEYMEWIGDYFMANCTSFIEFPDDFKQVDHIGQYFLYQTNIPIFFFPNKVKEFGAHIAVNCFHLSKVRLPKTNKEPFYLDALEDAKIEQTISFAKTEKIASNIEVFVYPNQYADYNIESLQKIYPNKTDGKDGLYRTLEFVTEL